MPIASQPTYADYRHAAEAALARRETERARQITRAMVRTRPREAHGHFLLGMAEAGAGRVSAAVDAIHRAVKLSARPDYLAQLARLLILLKRDGEALEAADRAAAMRDVDALSCDTLGCIYSRLGNHEKAMPLFERAVAERPRQLEFRFNMAANLGFLGRVPEAAQAYEEIIAIDPAHVKAHAALSHLRKQTHDDNHIARLEAVLARAANSTDRLHLQYALAKEYEDLAQYEESYRHLADANSRRKAELGYDVETDLRLGRALEAHFRRDDYFRGESDVTAAPIFIVGLPRTGTTLVDRILASHPEITSAGELQAMPVALKRLAGTKSHLTLDPETIAAAGTVAPAELGRLYMRAAAAHSRGEGRFTDKLPLNFLYLGYIARALPRARIVCLRRDPMDSVWSNFKHLFATNFSYYNYSYDLMDTAAYYRMFDRLMALWQTLFPGRILEVSYEALVDDLDGEVRRLLAHCGLAWSSQCLSFHENTAAVATPSAPQVRQPIYRSSIGKWRNYADHMKNVQSILDQATEIK